MALHARHGANVSAGGDTEKQKGEGSFFPGRKDPKRFHHRQQQRMPLLGIIAAGCCLLLLCWALLGRSSGDTQPSLRKIEDTQEIYDEEPPPAFPMQEVIDLVYEPLNLAEGDIDMDSLYFDYDPNPSQGQNTNNEAITTGCAARDDTYDMIHKQHLIAVASTFPSKTSKRILCIVAPSDADVTTTAFIQDTWATRCDGFLRVSYNGNIPNSSTQNWPALWLHIYLTYYQDYDWFQYTTPPNALIIIDNLRSFLQSDEMANAESSGGAALAYQGQVAMVLGPPAEFSSYDEAVGYALNKAAVKLLVTQGLPMVVGDNTLPKGISVVQLFRTRLRVIPYEATDDHGVALYHPLPPSHYYRCREQNCIAKHSIAFGSINNADLMYRLYALLYGVCPEDDATQLGRQ